MTKRLVLMRHAKSSWDDLSLDDHARPLNARGRKAARAIGAWLTSLDIAPDMILCSDAVRTKETHQRLKVDGPVHMRPDLYLASLDRILTV
ncbi:MAG: SixA phosphatase family protein, partial [Pseudooceanicola atlanticus]